MVWTVSLTPEMAWRSMALIDPLSSRMRRLKIRCVIILQFLKVGLVLIITLQSYDLSGGDFSFLARQKIYPVFSGLIDRSMMEGRGGYLNFISRSSGGRLIFSGERAMVLLDLILKGILS